VLVVWKQAEPLSSTDLSLLTALSCRHNQVVQHPGDALQHDKQAKCRACCWLLMCVLYVQVAPPFPSRQPAKWLTPRLVPAPSCHRPGSRLCLWCALGEAVAQGASPLASTPQRRVVVQVVVEVRSRVYTPEGTLFGLPAMIYMPLHMGIDMHTVSP
jgi:hypothetical protein